MAIRNKKVTTSWSVVEARTRLDQVVDKADDAGPQTLVKNGSGLVVLIPVDTWTNEPIENLADFFASARLQEDELVIPARAGSSRRIEW